MSVVRALIDAEAKRLAKGFEEVADEARNLYPVSLRRFLLDESARDDSFRRLLEERGIVLPPNNSDKEG